MKKRHINWSDGMKVNKSHFVGMEHAIRNELLDHSAVHLTSYNYGLIACEKTVSSCDLYFKLDQSGQVILNLLSCKAVTPGGTRITIEQQEQYLEEYRISKESISERLHNSEEDALYVVAVLEAYNRKPYGESLPGEDPPRQPYSIPKQYLQIYSYREVSDKNIEGTFQLIVGRIIRTENGPEKDENYIPPCIAVNAFDKLLKVYTVWEENLETKLLTNLKNTLQKIEHIGLLDTRDEKTIVAQAVWKITRALIGKLVELIPSSGYRKEQPFLLSLSAYQQLAWIINIEFTCLSDNSRTKLHNYLKEALNIDHFQQQLDDYINFKYKHNRIDKAVAASQKFFSLLDNLFHAKNGLPAQSFDWKYNEGVIEIEIAKEQTKRITD